MLCFMAVAVFRFIVVLNGDFGFFSIMARFYGLTVLRFTKFSSFGIYFEGGLFGFQSSPGRGGGLAATGGQDGGGYPSGTNRRTLRWR